MVFSALVEKFSMCFPVHSFTVVLLAVNVLLLSQLFCAKTACPPPDSPFRGKYKPMKARYEVGETVNYRCYKGLPVFDENKKWIQVLRPLICEESGKWNKGSYFCETPVKLTNKMTSYEALDAALFDGDDAVCSRTRNDTEEVLQFTLEREVVVFSILMCWENGKKEIKVSGNGWESTFDVETDSCSFGGFYDQAKKTREITVQITSDTSSTIDLCKLQVFGTDDNWCLHPPVHSFENGRLEVNRSKAFLRCSTGFREEEGREVYATCKNNTWSYSKLQCIGKECKPDVGNVTITQGKWEKDDKTSPDYVGKNRTLICEHGYHSEGAPLKVTCLNNGDWTRTSATCKRTECRPNVGNVTLTEGKWEKDDKTSRDYVGKKRTLICEHGLHSIGAPLKVTCLNNGDWTRTSATCTKKRKRKLTLIHVKWHSEKNQRIDYKFNTQQHLYKGVEDKTENDSKILGNFIAIKTGRTSWHFKKGQAS